MSYDYVDSLDVKHRKRYDEKVILTGLTSCPYRIQASLWKEDPRLWPEVTFPDIVMYLTLSPGVFTNEAMRNYRSTESWKMVQSGWVQVVRSYECSDVTILRAKVKPSMRVNDPHHNPWVAIDGKKGGVITAHCDCKAGLGESCSHVGALLFKVEMATRLGYTKVTCTDMPCQWNNDFVHKVQPDEVSKIAFYNKSTISKMESSQQKSMPPASTHEEQQLFLDMLSNTGEKPVGLSTFNDFARHFKSAPVAPQQKLPQDMRSLYISGSDQWSAKRLDEKLSSVMATGLRTSVNEILYLQSQTLTQAKSLVWHQMRAGRVTSTRTKEVVTAMQKGTVSQSLVMGLCNYNVKHGGTEAMRWGTTHESQAKKEYIKYMHESGHHDFSFTESGLTLHEDFQFIGASLDGLAHCVCCGTRAVEIKCPFKHRNSSVDELYDDKQFYLTQEGLKKTHQYFYQVQTHMLVTGLDLCDFIVWTPNFFLVEPVEKDCNLCHEIIVESSRFFRQHLLPELITRKLESSTKALRKAVPTVPTTTATPVPTCPVTSAPKLFCYCQQPEDPDQDWVGCDNHNCKFEWFHLKCLKRKTMPSTDTWYCKECRKVQGPPSKKQKK